MAVKDTAPYLPDCLDSILSQTYQNWELIAVNDHSADESPNILKAYAVKDSRVRVFNAEQPRLIPALQRGYRETKGSLINRMDSDDKMPSDKLEDMVKEWLKHGKGTVIAGGVEHFVDEGTVGEGFLNYETWLNEVARTNCYKQEIYRECVLPSNCWLVHKDDFDAAGAFDPLVYPEDYDLCFRFYQAGLNFIGLDKVTHYWRDRPDRISRTWEEYKDNRYFELKLHYFHALDRDQTRPLVLWGAGKNGKDMAKLLQSYHTQFHWVCNNERKIGKHIFGELLAHYKETLTLENPQIFIAVSSPSAKKQIERRLISWGKKPGADFWFFL